MDDKQIESEIQAKGLTAPRVTASQVEATIITGTYTVLPSGRTMICELTLRNGFTVRGESSCVSIENFNEELGRKISYDDAVSKVWQLEAYLLKQRLFDQAAAA